MNIVAATRTLLLVGPAFAVRSSSSLTATGDGGARAENIWRAPVFVGQSVKPSSP
jgi:hypothetical protein